MPEELVVRTMGRSDLDIAMQWASKEGWNPGLHDADAFYHADPSGFFAGFVSGVQVACISSVAYDDSFGFLGLYIVKPEFRGRGFGIRIWERALDYLGDRNIGLDGVVARQADYEKYGFRFAYRNLRFAGSVAAHDKSKNIVNLNDLDIKQVAQYDCQMFPARRDKFLPRWIAQQGGKALGCLTDGKLAGYGVLRPCVTGFKIGPLFADSKKIAQDLISGLAGHVDGQVFIDVPEPNHDAVDLVQASGMKKVFETARMYNKSIPRLPLGRVYGVTTLELG